MRKNNVVSIWLGVLPSEDSLMAYSAEDYSDDGDAIPSKFEQDFSIDPMDYEYDFFERFSCDYASGSVEEILQSCPYDDSVIDSLKNIVGEKLKHKYNCAFLIYDYDPSTSKGINGVFSRVPFFHLEIVAFALTSFYPISLMLVDKIASLPFTVALRGSP